MKMVYKNIPIEVSDIDETEGIIKGYGSIFGNEDSDGDVIVKGAYKKTLKENGHRVKYCWQHDIKNPIAKFTEIGEDETGLPFVAKFSMNSATSRDKFFLIKDGVVDENSVGIQIINSKLDKEQGVSFLNEVKLFEISAVTLAANDLARTYEAKGMTKEDIAISLLKRFDDLSKFIRKNDITDDMGYAIEGELLALKTLTEEIITKPSMTDTLPRKEEETEVDYKSFLKFL